MRHPLVINSEGKIWKKSKWAWQRSIEKARQEIMNQEDAAMFKILDDIAASGSGNNKE